MATQTTHLRNFRKKLGDRVNLPCNQILLRDLEQFLRARLKERKAETVSKERFTIVKLFEWAVAHGCMDASPAAGLPTIKGNADKQTFRTIAEIESILTRGGLDESQSADLWDCLYLTPPEMAELLTLVSARGCKDYAQLLHAIPAYTGMRRGEILRIRWSDIEFDQEAIIARSKKQSRQKSETARRIDLHPELKSLLLAWRERRPRGQYVICEADADGPITEKTATRYFCQPLRGTAWCLNVSVR